MGSWNLGVMVNARSEKQCWLIIWKSRMGDAGKKETFWLNILTRNHSHSQVEGKLIEAWSTHESWNLVNCPFTFVRRRGHITRWFWLWIGSFTLGHVDTSFRLKPAPGNAREIQMTDQLTYKCWPIKRDQFFTNLWAKCDKIWFHTGIKNEVFGYSPFHL